MSQLIYIVEAEKGWQYDGGQSSIVYTSLDQADAMAFARDYFDRNESLTVEVQNYDYLTVTVSSSVIGKANTESILWVSGRQCEVSLVENRANMEFADNLEQSLLESFKRDVTLSICPSLQINPTIGFASGLVELETSLSKQDSIKLSNHAVDQYARYLKQVATPVLVDITLAKGSLDLIEADAESKDNLQEWELYATYERQYYMN